MGAIYSIQQANTPTGEYDVRQSRLLPYHVDPSGTVRDQDLWQGDPAAVIGFQAEADVQTCDLLWQAAIDDPEKMIGMFPIFSSGQGFWSSGLPVKSVIITHEDKTQEHYPKGE